MTYDKELDELIKQWCKEHIGGDWGVVYQTLGDSDSLANSLEPLLRRVEVEAELRGLDLVENARRVPVELMSAVIERKKELEKEQ